MKVLGDVEGSFEPTNKEAERIRKLMQTRISRTDDYCSEINYKTGEELEGKVTKSFINRSIEVQGALCKWVYHTPYGIKLYRTDKSEWIGKENILCIGVEEGIIKFKKAEDCQKAIKAIECYNEYFELNFNTPAKTTEGLGLLIEEEDKNKKEAKQIANEVIEKNLEDIRREITDKRVHEMNEFMREVALDYESKAREIHIMLAKSEIEMDTLEKVMNALKYDAKEDDGVSLGLFEGLSAKAPEEDEMI